MALYDSGITYDSGIAYDQSAQDQPKHMAKVKLNLRTKTDSQLLTFAQNHITAMTGNANFATPVPSAALFLTAVNSFQTSLSDATLAQQAAKQKTAAKDASRINLETNLISRGTYVDLTSNGDSVKIQSSGLDVKSTKTPPGIPPQVDHLSVSAGDDGGEVDLHWDSIASAKSYQIELSPDPLTASSWNSQRISTKSKVSISGQASGSRIWARVRAIGSAGAGAWSDPATKIVP